MRKLGSVDLGNGYNDEEKNTEVTGWGVSVVKRRIANRN